MPLTTSQWKTDSNTQISLRNPSVATWQGNAAGTTIIGGTASSDDLTLNSTSHATKGSILLGSATGVNFDEVNTQLGIGIVPTSRLHVVQTLTALSADNLMENHALTVNPASSSSANCYATQATTNVVGSAALSGNIFGFRADTTVSNTGGTTGDVSGLAFSTTQTNTSGTLLKVYGLVGQAARTGAGTTTNAYGVFAEITKTAGTITTAYALYGTATGGTTNWGLMVADGNAQFNGTAEVKAGSSIVYPKIGGSLYNNTTTANNSSTTETDLWSQSIAANALGTNGDSLHFLYTGTIQTSLNTKQLRVKFGATTIFDSTAQNPAVATDWIIEGWIWRTGATTQKSCVKLTTTGGDLFTFADYATAAETLSGAVTLVVTGQGAANNQITFEAGKIYYEPAP